MMRVLNDFEGARIERDLVATIGAFDGLHLGHQELLKSVVSHARDRGDLSGLITFDPHPRNVLTQAPPVICLTSPEEKARILEGLGLDVMVVLHFTREMSRMSPADFLDMAVKRLRLRQLWVGPDFALGRDREGHVSALQELAPELGFELRVVAAIERNGVPISSTRIRALLTEGRVAEAADLLGRYYRVVGRVVPGYLTAKRHELATTGLTLVRGCVLPLSGTYVAHAIVQEHHPLMGVAAVGIRPGFRREYHPVDMYVPCLPDQLHGQEIAIEFIRRLGPRLRFQTPTEYAVQLGNDLAQARHAEAPDEVSHEGPAQRQDMGTDRHSRGHEEIEHTADVALRIRGRDMCELLVNAAQGMFHLIGECEHSTPPHTNDHISLDAPDDETLLVDWLNELLYLHESKQSQYFAFDITKVEGGHLEACVGGNPPISKRRTIKAATFHDLRISVVPEGLEVDVVFDV